MTAAGPAGYAALIASAIPNLPGGIITSGTVGISYLPTGATGSTVPLGNDVRFNAAPSTAGGLPYDTGSAWAETAAGTVHQLLHGASGAPTWSAVALTSEVSGVLPVANGGTNSSTSLNNNRLMCSSGGAIVECSALTNGQIYIGSTGNAPQAATLTAGTNVTITNTAGGITIAASGGPTLPLSQANGGFGQDVSSGNTAGTSVTATASVADGSSAVDFKWNNNVAQSNASAELVEWDNNGTRKAAILAGGGAIHPSIGQEAVAAGAVSGEEVAHAGDAIRAATAALQLAQSRCQQHVYTVRNYGLPIIVCTDKWLTGATAADEEDLDWISKNAVIVEVSGPLWVE